jgi:hypothetical protein
MYLLTLIDMMLGFLLSLGAAAIVFSPHIHEGLTVKVGLACASLGLLLGAFAIGNDPTPYLPTLLCIAVVQLGLGVVAAGLALRLHHDEQLGLVVRAISGWGGLDEQPAADQ